MKIVLVLACLVASFNSFAKPGPGDGGGGDPATQQFITMGKKLGAYFEVNPFKQKLGFDAKTFSKKIEEIDQSIKDETAPDLLEFTDETLKDKDGVEKAALFDRKTSSVRVNRPIWTTYGDEQRLILMTMEVSGLMSVEIRYETAQNLVKDRLALILSTPVEGIGKPPTNTGGMRIVGQNPEQFENMTKYDVLIDAGVLGKDPARDERVVRFFENPTADAEWYGLIQKAWDMNRPAYFMVAKPEGGIVRLASIFVGVNAYWKENKTPPVGIGIYTMTFIKGRQIYDGPCVGDAEKLAPLDRVINCLLNPQHYYAEDSTNGGVVPEAEMPDVRGVGLAAAFQSFHKDTIGYFAYHKENLQEAVRDNQLYDYSGALISKYIWDQRAAWIAALKAHGYEPSLRGPYGNSLYWAKTGKPDAAAIREYEALKSLVEDGKGFIAAGESCKLPGGEILSGPKITDLMTIRKFKRLGNCGPNYYGSGKVSLQLFEALKQEKYYYNRKAQKWLRVEL